MKDNFFLENILKNLNKLKPYGDFKTTITISDFSFNFCGLSQGQKEYIEKSYIGFITEELKNLIRAEIGILENENDTYNEDFLLYNYEKNSFLVARYFVASREENNKNCILKIIKGSERNLLYAVENFLRWMISQLALIQNGVLLHASAKVIDGEAHIFLGNHGGGKSTAVSLIEEGFTIADDVVLILNRNNQYFAFAMPAISRFNQKIEEIGYYPIRNFYKLVKSEQNKLKKLSKAGAFAILLSSIPFLTNTNRHHYIAMNIIEKINLLELHFKKETNFLKKAYQSL